MKRRSLVVIVTLFIVVSIGVSVAQAVLPPYVNEYYRAQEKPRIFITGLDVYLGIEYLDRLIGRSRVIVHGEMTDKKVEQDIDKYSDYYKLKVKRVLKGDPGEIYVPRETSWYLLEDGKEYLLFLEGGRDDIYAWIDANYAYEVGFLDVLKGLSQEGDRYLGRYYTVDKLKERIEELGE